MKKQKPVVIGIVPVKRDFTELKPALAQKEKVLLAIAGLKIPLIEIVDLEGIVENGMVSEECQTEKVVGYLQEKNADAVFLLHCDFGNEVAAATIAKSLKKPVLLWGPRDDAPDCRTGKRTRDTQCGIFATSKVLQRYNLPFTYIVNCDADDGKFTAGFRSFARVASVVKAFSKMRILQVSARPRAFMSVMTNEYELLDKFGIEIIPVSLADIRKRMDAISASQESVLKETLLEISSRMDTSQMDSGRMTTMVLLKQALEDQMILRQCSGAAIECWSLMPGIFNINPCFAISELTGAGYPVACETDINGAITAVLLEAATLGEEATFFADLTMRHPTHDNAELLWHCGPFPYRLKHKDSSARIVDCHGEWRLKDGELTLARFDSIHDRYSLFAGEARTVEGPRTEGTYVWMEVDNWEEWEKKIINGPYIHHIVGTYGKYRDILAEACKYIPGLAPDLI